LNCSKELLEAWLDEELDPADCAALERHIQDCASCSDAILRLREQKAKIRAAAPYYDAPPQLRQAISDALRREFAVERAEQARRVPWRGLAVAASLLLAVSASWNILLLRRHTDSSLAESLVSAHVSSLLASHLVDVPSSDQHTVKPWFAGRLDFAPVVKDLDAQGFPLAGGRVEYLGGRRIAAVVYRRRLHVINLFTWPDGHADGGESRISRDGYNIVHWTTGPMTYWAVSDVSAPELERLRQFYRE
jgi:anti-sigma factor RsiW